MDPLLLIILLVILVILVILWKSNWFRGFFGELQVRMLLTLSGKNYFRMHGVILPSGRGSTEIDHLLFSPFGIFVIETKNRSGWIYGNQYDAQWTQTFQNGEKFHFQNPLRQNFKHTETIAELLRVPKKDVHSLIAFSGKAKLKTKLPENVMTYKRIPSYIKSFHERAFSKSQVNSFVNTIEEKRHRGVLAKLQHIWSLR